MADLTSYSKPEEVVVTHLDWEISVDFAKERLFSVATYSVRVLQSKATTLNLDTSHLDIVSAMGDDGTPLSYTLHPIVGDKPYLGRRLEINLPQCNDDEKTCRITVSYSTTKLCSALQWLPPSQTAGKEHPYLFTQCQAIHARSLVPCQDCCGVKMTYTATAFVPSWATCVMSALLEKEEVSEDNTKKYTWNQPVPICSYLLALAVGELTKKTISERCAVWSEPSVVESAAYEFSETEMFLSTAEAITGRDYAWGRYDLLCLPPSFPYGGMENPCLTFVTPTLLAGDKSLADVVAHEIAHSWTGNLVTNATWDHFWLNEGWTTWLQRKIMARMKDNPSFLDFDAIEGRKDMADTVEEFLKSAPENTSMVLNNRDGDPDDSYSTLAYEKGFTFLLYLERLVGTPEFEKFFQAYIARFASKTLTSTDFKDFFLEHFAGNSKINEIEWDVWFYAQGMPPVLPPLDQSMAKASTDLASVWYDFDRGATSSPATNEISEWASGQITCFLDALQSKTTEKALKVSTLFAMNKLYHLAESRNSEILFRYCQLAIASEDQSIILIALQFITSQGRMKYIRPLYKSLYKSKMGKGVAVSTFLKHKDIYHPIATKMIAIDLKDAMETSPFPSQHVKGLLMTGAAIAVVGIALAFARRSRK
mmetsp:Transcript_18088/g.39423  ORF Transcript_18088/g.39423 Transcript_18088/m.39423 type:complete len:650 (-) Transcript_18088:66-2015(-)|eukprot:CAMPEP_0168169888 /NCGR_PEP_ID=MMETSP0139_2-20121125/3879_1 /TAXON_ID=44445 /ORGANISM="Pseudo-nitzschia australis, Strain 10249 10 AB" /LENGTH=649 /DNA_ID=CAMNT_0008087339 /DNA_START=100 /DNA_END=2049 /DNA_ORIENTATION=-